MVKALIHRLRDLLIAVGRSKYKSLFFQDWHFNQTACNYKFC